MCGMSSCTTHPEICLSLAMAGKRSRKLSKAATSLRSWWKRKNKRFLFSITYYSFKRKDQVLCALQREVRNPVRDRIGLGVE